MPASDPMGAARQWSRHTTSPLPRRFMIWVPSGNAASMGAMTSENEYLWETSTLHDLGVASIRHNVPYDHVVSVKGDTDNPPVLASAGGGSDGKARIVAVMDDGRKVGIPDVSRRRSQRLQDDDTVSIVSAMVDWGNPWMDETLEASSPSMIDWMLRRMSNHAGIDDDRYDMGGTDSRLKYLDALNRMLKESHKAMIKDGMSGEDALGVLRSWLALAGEGALLPVRSVGMLGWFMGEGFPIRLERIPVSFMKVLRSVTGEPLDTNMDMCPTGYMQWAEEGMCGTTLKDYHGREDIAWMLAAAQAEESGCRQAVVFEGFKRRHGWKHQTSMRPLIMLASSPFADDNVLESMRRMLGDDPMQWMRASQAVSEIMSGQRDDLLGSGPGAHMQDIPSWDWVFELLKVGEKTSWDQRRMTEALFSAHAALAVETDNTVRDLLSLRRYRKGGITDYTDYHDRKGRMRSAGMNAPLRMGFRTRRALRGARLLLDAARRMTGGEHRQAPTPIMEALQYYAYMDDKGTESGNPRMGTGNDYTKMILLEEAAYAADQGISMERFNKLLGTWWSIASNGGTSSKKPVTATLAAIHWIMHNGLINLPESFLIEDQHMRSILQ